MKIYALVIFLGIVMISSTISMSSSDALLPENLPEVSQAPYKVKVIEANGFIAKIQPLLTTKLASSLYESGAGFSGVAVLDFPRTDIQQGFVAVCSGALISESLILTAAHCVTDDSGDFVLLPGAVARFGETRDTPLTTINIDEGATQIHPQWDGNFERGNDIAIIKLENSAPVGYTVYAIDSDGGNDVGAVGSKVGFGRSGTLAEGDVLGIGIKRNGLNQYDSFADTWLEDLGRQPDTDTETNDFVPGSVLMYDSDNGDIANDAFDFFFGISNLGLANDEVNSAPGDSGGPTLVNDEITGVTSYGLSLEYRGGPFPRTSDCTTTGNGPGGDSPILDSSCGEFSGDTRVSAYSSWIGDIISGGGGDTTAPTVSSTATVTTTSIDLTMSETVVDNSATPGDFTVSGVASVPSVTSITVSGSTVTLNLNNGMLDSDTTITVSYTQSGGTIDDSVGNSLADFAGQSVTNNLGGCDAVNVTGISEDVITKGTIIGVIISGSCFQDGASVTFENGCGPSPTAASVTFVDATSITAEITAKSGGPPRSCIFDVRVTNEDTSTNVLPGSFTVVSP